MPCYTVWMFWKMIWWKRFNIRPIIPLVYKTLLRATTDRKVYSILCDLRNVQFRNFLIGSIFLSSDCETSYRHGFSDHWMIRFSSFSDRVHWLSAILKSHVHKITHPDCFPGESQLWRAYLKRSAKIVFQRAFHSIRFHRNSPVWLNESKGTYLPLYAN